MAFDPITAYKAARAAALLSEDNNWAKILMIILFVLLIPMLLIIMLPTVLFSNPVDTPEIEIGLADYLNTASDLNISYAYLISYDTGLYENNFEGITSENVLSSAFMFVDYQINEYEYDEYRVYVSETMLDNYNIDSLKYDARSDSYYYMDSEKVLKKTHQIKSLNDMKQFLNKSHINSYDIKQKLDDLNDDSMFDVEFIYYNFTDVVNHLDDEMKEYAIALVESGIYESHEFNFNLYDDIDLANLIEYDRGNELLPYYNQTDIRWALSSYGSSTILSAGCGPTSLAMVASGLIGDDSINPRLVSDWSANNGHRAEGSGTYWSLMTSGGRHFGLNVEAVSRKNPDKIIEALKNGYPVIASMGPGNFTRSGHFIVLSGITSQGMIKVHDSASIKRTKQLWTIDLIMRESSKNGGENGSPFWIFKP